ncbi:hypothetical protein CMV_011447 [Castanea mollissima]|uniref:Uncharacterized protein n=1 Tax=Castanea mollissima TaxID=60419 RepID=A0A8J4R389_9ROSI|nr:hypothetical protein CMV_011447 [Castanea mollissima]
MSRCIPFPPPGYVWNGESGEALIELIKLNRERVEAEKERKKEKRRRKKETRRRKREKRRRKKEEKRRREDGEVGQEMQNQQNRNKDGSKKRSWEKGDNEKGRKYEAQGLETSSLTEELEQPTISEFIYDSSDNSNNIKRKRVKCSPNASHNHESHFNFQKQKHEDQAVLSSKPACSTPTCTDTLVQQEFEMDPRLSKDKFCSTSGLPTTAQEMASRTTREMCLSPFSTEVVSDEKAETAPALSLSESAASIIRDEAGMLIYGYTCNIDEDSILMAELWPFKLVDYCLASTRNMIVELETDAEADFDFMDMVIHQKPPQRQLPCRSANFAGVTFIKS